MLDRLRSTLSRAIAPGEPSELDVVLGKGVVIDPENWPWSLPADVALLGGGAADARRAVGVPALLGVLRLISGSVGMMPTIVYQQKGETRERARDSWQWELLHQRPSEQTAAAFRSDLAMSLATAGDFFVRKLKVRAGTRDERVGQLIVLDPRQVRPYRENGFLYFEDQSEGTARRRTSTEIIHGRLGAYPGGLCGIAPISELRLAVQAALSRMQFELSHYRNDARPGINITFPGGITVEQAREWLELWKVEHQGLQNVGQPSVMGGGGTIDVLPISLADAQFAEATRLTREQVCGVYQVPPGLVGDTAQPASERDEIRFVKFALGPIVTAIDETLSADRDLFPARSGMWVEHLADALLRPDTRTRYEAYKAARQGSWMAPNEIRALENLPAVPGGDEIQLTPVGGAPNPGAAKQLLALALERARLDGTDLSEELEQLRDS